MQSVVRNEEIPKDSVGLCVFVNLESKMYQRFVQGKFNS